MLKRFSVAKKPSPVKIGRLCWNIHQTEEEAVGDVLSHEMNIHRIIVQTVNCNVNILVCSFYFLIVLTTDAKCKF